jgi:hypothetical protein
VIAVRRRSQSKEGRSPAKRNRSVSQEALPINVEVATEKADMKNFDDNQVEQAATVQIDRD